MAKQQLTKTRRALKKPKEVPVEVEIPDWAVLLKKAREFKFKTAVEFARRCGWSQQRYSHYENGKRFPKIAEWRKIRDTLDMTIDRIWFGPDAKLEASNEMPSARSQSQPNRRASPRLL